MKQHKKVFILLCLDNNDDNHNNNDIGIDTKGQGGVEASPHSCLLLLSAVSQQMEER